MKRLPDRKDAIPIAYKVRRSRMNRIAKYAASTFIGLSLAMSGALFAQDAEPAGDQKQQQTREKKQDKTGNDNQMKQQNRQSQGTGNGRGRSGGGKRGGGRG